LEKVLRFAEIFRNQVANDHRGSILSKNIQLSVRQLLRICRRASYPDSDLYSIIMNTCISPFLPQLAKRALEDIIKEAGIVKSSPKLVIYLVLYIDGNR
jgi:hypothetical protein